MIKPAALYKEEIVVRTYDLWYNPKYQYLFGAYMWNIDFNTDTSNKRQFVVLDEDDEPIGYFHYNIQAATHSIESVIAYTFGNDNRKLYFIKEVIKELKRCILEENFDRIEWFAYDNNPAARGYKNLSEKYGGGIVAHFHKNANLSDNTLHDVIYYEILKENIPEKYKK